MIIPTVTGQDTWNFLINTLKSSSLVAYQNMADHGYYAHVLLYNYLLRQRVTLTATTLQVLQWGISAVLVRLTLEQHAQQRVFDGLNLSWSAAITKRMWLRVLRDATVSRFCPSCLLNA